MQATDVETGKRQVAALRDFAAGPALADLERLLSDSRTERRRALERFAADDRLPELKRLIAEAGAQAGGFNLFDLLALVSDETRHSKILGWLFDPAQNHGIGTAFLTDFLAATGAEAVQHGITSAAMPAGGWETTGVELEWLNRVGDDWGYLDILIVNRQERFLCAIENKIWAAEHSEQLTRYRKALEAAYPDYTRHLVFLSPRGVAPYRVEERKFWTPVSYSTVLSVLDRIIQSAAMPSDVSTFLRQYATTLRRHIVPETTEIQQLARKIYLEHKEVIDLIYRHRPDYVAETKQILKEAVEQRAGWTLDKEDAGFVRFRSDAWDEFPATRTGTGWTPSPALLLFEFALGYGLPYIQLALSPGENQTVREKLVEAARQNPTLFRPTSRTFQQGFMVLLQESDCILDASDYGVKWDDGCSVRAKIMAWVDDFAKTRFPAMNKVILNCLREYEAERNGHPAPDQ